MLFPVVFMLSFTDCSPGFMFREKASGSWSHSKEKTTASPSGLYWKKPAYAGRFLVKEQGNYTIKAYVGSNDDITVNSLIIRLNISDKQVNQSDFTTVTLNSRNYTATYTDYLHNGTYIYFYFEHGDDFWYSYSALYRSFNGGEFEYFCDGENCETCDEGDPCVDDTRNPGQMCAPHTYSAVSLYTLNEIAHKAALIGSLFTLLY